MALRDDYSGPFDPGCQLHDFSHRALVRLNQKFAVQALLLMHAYLVSRRGRGVDPSGDGGAPRRVGLPQLRLAGRGAGGRECEERRSDECPLDARQAALQSRAAEPDRRHTRW
jgi:hypothetical protein